MDDLISPSFKEIALSRLEKQGPGVENTSSAGEGLQTAKDKLNKYEIKPSVPLLGGTGLGDFWLGEAPSMYKDLAIHGPKAAFTPEYAQKQGRTGPLAALDYIDSRMLDLTFLGLDVGGIVGGGLKAISSGGKAVARKASEEINKTTQVSRREFVKKAAAVGAGAMVAPKLMEMARPAVKEGTKRVVDNAPVATVKRHKYNTLAEYNEYLNKTVADSPNLSKQGVAEFDEDIYLNIKELNKKAQRADLEVVPNGYPFKLRENQMTMKQKEYFEHMSSDLEAFSPKAKAEMKDFKSKFGKDDFESLDDWIASESLPIEDMINAGVGGITVTNRHTLFKFLEDFVTKKRKENPIILYENEFKSGDSDRGMARYIEAYRDEIPLEIEKLLQKENVLDLETGEMLNAFEDGIRGGHIGQLKRHLDELEN